MTLIKIATAGAGTMGSQVAWQILNGKRTKGKSQKEKVKTEVRRPDLQVGQSGTSGSGRQAALIDEIGGFLTSEN